MMRMSKAVLARGERTLVAEVPPSWRRDQIRWLVLERDSESGGWFLLLHRTLNEPCEFDEWHLTRQDAMDAAHDAWGVRPADWRE